MKTTNSTPGKVGLFYYIKGLLVGLTTDISTADEYGEFKIHLCPHDLMWEKIEKYFVQKDCYYYPRGRVTYHVPEDTFIIYIDQCLDQESIKKLIVEKYKLAGLSYRFAYDDHYRCHLCIGSPIIACTKNDASHPL